jgi:hypothetical protein
MSPWEASAEDLAGRKLHAVSRTITSRHPFAVTFPGLGTHADSAKTQVLACIGDDQMLMVDTTSFSGFPYSDHVSTTLKKKKKNVHVMSV